MIEKIKYCLSKISNPRRIRVSCIAVITALTIAVVTLLGCSINTIKIFDGEKTYTVHTLSTNVASVLSGVKLKSNNYNVKKTTVSGRFATVLIEYAFPVYITQGENTVEVEFTGGTVADALALAGFTIDDHDFIQPSADTVIKSTEYIDYTNIDYVDGSYTEPIPYAVETVYSSSKAKGSTSVEAGSEGVQQVNYTDKIVNGVTVEKIITSTTVLSNPVNSKEVVGTKSVPAAVTTSANVKSVSTLTPAMAISLDSNGAPVSYKSKMTARATAYTYTGNNCATGVAPQPGYIAVNPKVIPYGTKMYIKTADGNFVYGYAVAADTGGFVSWSPNGVDLFMSSKSACVNFGVQNVEIYILE